MVSTFKIKVYRILKTFDSSYQEWWLVIGARTDKKVPVGWSRQPCSFQLLNMAYAVSD
jgi:hypothetical protein